MAGRIYSTRFYLTPDTPTVGHFNPPVGMIGVVRDMRCWIPHPGSWPLGPVCQVVVDEDTSVIWEISGHHPATGVYSWTGRQVFTNVLQWFHQDTEAQLTASGYLLSAT